MGSRMTRLMIHDPAKLVCGTARGYLYRGLYPQIRLFTKYPLELDHLTQTFGGHYYPHLAGYIWVLSKQSEVQELLTKVKPYLPSRYGFESILRDDGSV